jgi:2-hydroxy-3-oxopropionate reductase
MSAVPAASTAPLRVGYIGLGLMGKHIARNILKAGFPVVVHNRSRGKVQELVAEGAEEGTSAADVAGRVDIVMTNLPDSPDVFNIVFGKDGCASTMKPGTIFIDNSTIKPATSRDIAARLKEIGVIALDAPVSGGDIGAKNGTLSIMVGGDEDAYNKAMPVFQAMGKTFSHIGDAGAGQVCKAANQIMVAAQMTAMAELLVFSQKGGVDPEKVVGAIKGGAAGCWTLDNKPPRIFAGNRGPGFKASMQHKDLGIVVDSAREFGAPIPVTSVNMSLYESMLQQEGMSELDNSAVLGVHELLANTRVGPAPAAGTDGK